MSGHHGEIEKWRRQEGLRRTLRRRPDLLHDSVESALSPGDVKVLAQLRAEVEQQS
jgi:tRNA (guanine37-N1)-methyltransferase